MSQHTPNELTTIFKRDRELITHLKGNDAHFARLAEEYHEVNRQVHRIEAETEAASDERFETLKSIVTSALDQELTSGMPKLEFFRQHLPMSGEIRVFLRIDQQANAKLEAVKSRMAESLSDPCSVREAVLYCAFATANFAD